MKKLFLCCILAVFFAVPGTSEAIVIASFGSGTTIAGGGGGGGGATAFNISPTTLDTTYLGFTVTGGAALGSTTDGISASASGILLKHAISTTDGAYVYIKTPVDTSVASTMRIRLKSLDTSAVVWIGLYQLSSGLPTNKEYDIFNLGSVASNFSGRGPSGSVFTVTSSPSSYTPSANTEYDYILHTDGAGNLTLTLKSTSGTTLMTGTAALSSFYTYPNNTLYYFVTSPEGDGYSANHEITQVQVSYP